MTGRASVLRLRRRDLVTIGALALGQAATLVYALVLLRQLIDGLSGGAAGHARVMRGIPLLLVVVLVNSALRGIEFSVSERAGYGLIRALRMRMYRHLQGMSVRQIQGRSRGGLLLRFTGDLSMLRTWVSRGLARGLVSAVVLVGGLGVVAYLNVRLALTIGAVLAFGSAALVRIGPRLQRVTKAVRRKRSLLTSNIAEQINALAVVQVFGRSGGEYDRLASQNDSMTESLEKTARIRGRMLTISSATGWLAIVGVLTVGAIEIAAGNASVGTVATAMIACRQLAGPVRRLGLSYDYWQRAHVSRKKILDFLASSSRPLDDPAFEDLRVGRGTIELQGLTVRGALYNVCGTIAGGHTIAVLGSNGAGKSTLLAAIAGLVDPDAGSIVIDGHPAEERTLRSRFRRIGMVGPDLPLMHGTVGRNLTYRCPQATDDEIARIVANCRLEDIIEELPGGLSGWLTEGGRNLSLGQRQRLALGRALIGNPPILLLDEPTVNLDQAGAEAFRTAVSHHRGTVVIATHDRDEAALADEVWMLDGGRLAERIDGDEYRSRLWHESRAANGGIWRPARTGTAGR